MRGSDPRREAGTTEPKRPARERRQPGPSGSAGPDINPKEKTEQHAPQQEHTDPAREEGRYFRPRVLRVAEAPLRRRPPEVLRRFRMNDARRPPPREDDAIF